MVTTQNVKLSAQRHCTLNTDKQVLVRSASLYTQHRQAGTRALSITVHSTPTSRYSCAQRHFIIHTSKQVLVRSTSLHSPHQQAGTRALNVISQPTSTSRYSCAKNVTSQSTSASKNSCAQYHCAIHINKQVFVNASVNVKFVVRPVFVSSRRTVRLRIQRNRRDGVRGQRMLSQLICRWRHSTALLLPSST